MNKHTWEKDTSNNSEICRACGASGMPMALGVEPPRTGAFLMVPLSFERWKVLSVSADDCDEARKQIEAACVPCPVCRKPGHQKPGPNCKLDDHAAFFPLSVFTLESEEWVIAHTPTDAVRVFHGMLGSPIYEGDLGSNPTDWKALPPEKPFTFRDEDDDTRETRPCSEWIALRGRGHLGSANY